MAVELPDDPLLNKVLDGKYCLVERIAAGGMGVVYRTHCTTDPETPLAVKMVHYAYNKAPELCQLFRQEIAMLARIRHAHVVRLLDHGESETGPYYVMPYYSGCDLSDTFSKSIRTGKLSCAELVEVGRQACTAMVAVHRAGILHRDIKPENIFLWGWSPGAVRRVDVILMDFGTAVYAEYARALLRLRRDAGHLSGGTPEYIAPELLAGEGLDEHSDIWSLGMVLYEVLANRLPFMSYDVMKLICSVTSADPPPLRRFKPEIPENLSRLVDAAIARDPKARPQTMVEFGARLKECASEVAALEQSRASFLSTLGQRK